LPSTANAIEALREALHEAHEAGLKWFGVELAKHPTATAKCPVDPVAFGDHALATTLAFLAKLDDDRKIAIR
jgi:hypothetical protein